MNSSIWPNNGTLKGTTLPCQSEPESYRNEGVLHIRHITEALLSDAV